MSKDSQGRPSNKIIKILMERDDYSYEDAVDHFNECVEYVANGADPEEVLYEELGLEPDYIEYMFHSKIKVPTVPNEQVSDETVSEG